MRNFPAVTWSPVWSWGTCSGQVRRSEAEILRCDRSDFRSIHMWSGPLEQIIRGSKPAIYRNQAPPLVHPCDQAVSTSLMSETHHTGRQAERQRGRVEGESERQEGITRRARSSCWSERHRWHRSNCPRLVPGALEAMPWQVTSLLGDRSPLGRTTRWH